MTTEHDVLTADRRAHIVEATARILEQHYVFPERGAHLAQHLRDSAETCAESDLNLFCAALTQAMRAHTPDRHLRVERAPRGAEDRTCPRLPSAAGLTAVRVLDGNVGYLELVAFESVTRAAPVLSAAMQILVDTTALIIDLRHNGGGDPATTSFLLGYFFAESAHVTTFHDREGGSVQTWTPAFLPSPRYLDRPLALLTSRGTGSGAEEFTYVLKHLGRARLFGETTAGAAHPGRFESLPEGLRLFVPTGRPIVPLTNANWEGEGVAPHEDVAQDAALDVALTWLGESA